MTNRRAFTLVEMLVTSTMLVLIVTAGFAAFGGGMRSAAKVKRYGRMISCGQLALRAMAADLRAAVEHGDVKLTALDVKYEGRDCDTIDFIIARPNPTRKEKDESGRAEIGYHIDKNPEVKPSLLRRVDRTLDDDPLEGGALSVVGAFVTELDLEFYDGMIWTSGWEERKDFPRAVRIQMVVVDENEIEKPILFRTTVSVMAQ